MGKSTTPTKWFKAVKKAFRSPSKEKPSPKGKDGDAGDEKPLNKQDFSPVSYASTTPHPLPSFEGVTHNHNESQQQGHGSPPPVALHATPDSAMTNRRPKEAEEPAQQQHSWNGNRNCNGVGNVYGVEKRQEDSNDSALSEEDKAATRIQQRFFRNPMALKGLIRLQALVRGQLVRRQAAITLRTMEAIVRMQALFRGRRVRMSKDGRAVKTRISRIQRLSSRVRGDARREAFQGMELETSEAEHEANKRKRRTAYLLTQQLKRSTPNRSSSFIDCDPDQPHEGWAWLELWTNAKAWESRQLEAAKLDPKDYIEIIPGSSRRTSDYPPTVNEVDFHTLNQAKYHESGNGNGISHSNPISSMDGKSAASASPEKGFFSPNKSTYGSPHLTTPSPAASQDAAAAAASPVGIPPSPNSSEASVKPNFADEEEASLAMDHLVLPEAANGSNTPSDSFSTSNGVHEQLARPGLEDALNGEAPVFEVVNGGLIPEHVSHHQDNGEDGTQAHPRKDFESPVLPVGSVNPRPTCRYMSATASAKAKFRSSSNPKNRTGGATTPELAPEASPSPVAAAAPPVRKHRKSIGGGTTLVIGVGNGKATQSPNKTPVAFGTGKTTNRRNSSPKTTISKEKPHSVDVGHDGVLTTHRNSWGSGDDKRWRT